MRYALLRWIVAGTVLGDEGRQGKAAFPHDSMIAQDILDLCSGHGASEEREQKFHRVFRRYYPSILTFFARRGVPEKEREDLAQETFLRLYDKIHSFNGDGSFEGWLYKIAANLHYNHLRAEKAHKRGQPYSLESLFKTDENSGDVNDLVEDLRAADPLLRTLERESYLILSRTLDKLPPKMRRCVLLRVFHELKYQEIADLLSISIQTVKAHLFQARQRLQKSLGEHFDKNP